MWKELVEQLMGEHPYVKVQPPATTAQIESIEHRLGVQVPQDLNDFLSETNGDGDFIMSAEQIIEDNQMLRGIDGYMPLDCLLFFGTDGCGNYVGYPITKDGLRADNVFFWDHEYDNRKWCANNLKEVIQKFYSGAHLDQQS